jgi:hypothetical protein
MPNPYANHPKHVHEHETDGTSQSCFSCKREAWEEGRAAGFNEGQEERRVAVALVTVLDKLLTMIEAGASFGDLSASLDAGGALAKKAAKAYLAR